MFDALNVCSTCSLVAGIQGFEAVCGLVAIFPFSLTDCFACLQCVWIGKNGRPRLKLTSRRSLCGIPWEGVGGATPYALRAERTPPCEQARCIRPGMALTVAAAGHEASSLCSHPHNRVLSGCHEYPFPDPVP